MKKHRFMLLAGLMGIVALPKGAQASEAICVTRMSNGQPSYHQCKGNPDDQLLMVVANPPLLTTGAAPRDRAGSRAGFRAGTRATEPQGAIKSLIHQAGRRHALDPKLLTAVIRQESGFNPEAVSVAGARGLMQLMPGTAKRYGATALHDPGENIAAGSAYLRDLLNQFGSLELALAAYNAGEGAVLKYGRRIPPYAETQKYVAAILADYRRP
jgi:soluble lytic murein transglycosylase-like protein